MWVPIGVKYHIPMELFYSLNPKKILRYQPYMEEWIREHHSEVSETGWTHGIYIQRAVGSVLSKHGKYPDSPLTLYSSDIDRGDEESYTLTDADRFFGFAMMFNKSHEKQFKETYVAGEGEVIDVEAKDVAKATDDIDRAP